MKMTKRNILTTSVALASVISLSFVLRIEMEIPRRSTHIVPGH